jgi:tetratricopeptide (TPR) repeat protein
MKTELLKRAEILAEAGQFQDALMLLTEEIVKNQQDWYPRYLAGQCEQFLGNTEKALDHLREAVRLNDETDPAMLNALAIAHQKLGQYPEALDALRPALGADREHVPSMNTLATTQKLMGEPEKASANYDIALRILAHRIAHEMINSEDNPIYKHQPWESTHDAWAFYAMQGAIFLAERDRIEALGWPQGDTAAREEETEEHKGFLWNDSTDEQGNAQRAHWPNYFTTFRESIILEPLYTELIANRSEALRLLGQTDEADKLQAEAQFIVSRRNGQGGVLADLRA